MSRSSSTWPSGQVRSLWWATRRHRRDQRRGRRRAPRSRARCRCILWRNDCCRRHHRGARRRPRPPTHRGGATTSQSDSRCLNSGQPTRRRSAHSPRSPSPVHHRRRCKHRRVRRNRLGVDPHRRSDLGIVVPLDCHRAGLTRAIDDRVRPPAPWRSCARALPAARRPLPREMWPTVAIVAAAGNAGPAMLFASGTTTGGVVGCRDAQRSDATHGPAGRHCHDPPTPGPHPDRGPRRWFRRGGHDDSTERDRCRCPTGWGCAPRRRDRRLRPRRTM